MPGSKVNDPQTLEILKLERDLNYSALHQTAIFDWQLWFQGDLTKFVQTSTRFYANLHAYGFNFI